MLEGLCDAFSMFCEFSLYYNQLITCDYKSRGTISFSFVVFYKTCIVACIIPCDINNFQTSIIPNTHPIERKIIGELFQMKQCQSNRDTASLKNASVQLQNNTVQKQIVSTSTPPPPQIIMNFLNLGCCL